MSERTWTKLTYEDYLQFPEDGNRHEILEGEHAVTPAPNTRHQRVSRQIFTRLAPFVEEHRLGEVLHAPYDVILSEETIVQPDLLFVSQARIGVIAEEHLRGAPDLIVEIVSDRTRKKDEVTKRKLYERFGVQEYWVVDPQVERVRVYRLTEMGYASPLELACEAYDQLTSPLLPGFALPLDVIFAA